jgi:hypothetical protein
MENPFVLVPPAIAAVVFLVLGVVCWSYRDVYNRHGGRDSYVSDHSNDGH